MSLFHGTRVIRNWWTAWHWNWIFSEYFGVFSPICTIPQTIHTHSFIHSFINPSITVATYSWKLTASFNNTLVLQKKGKVIPSFYKICSFITTFIRSRHWSYFQPNKSRPQPISVKSTLILSSYFHLVMWSCILSSRFTTKMLLVYALISFTTATFLYEQWQA